MFTRIFLWILLIQPIAMGADIDMDVFDLVFFRTSVIVLFLASLFDTKKRELPGYAKNLIAGLIGLCLYNIFVHTFAQPVLANTMNLFLGIIAFSLVYCYYDTKKSMVKYMLIAGCLNLILLVLQRVGLDPIFDIIPQNTKYLAGAFMGNSPRLGIYFALLTPYLPILLLPLAILVSIFIGQYTMLIPVLLIVFSKIKNNWHRILGIGVCGVSALFLKSHILRSFALRFNNAWKPGLEYFFDKPLIGHGVGITINKSFLVMSTSYIQIMLGFGILSLVWVGWLIKNIKEDIDFTPAGIGLVSLLILMAVEYPIELPRLRFSIIAIIVMFMLKPKREVENVVYC